MRLIYVAVACGVVSTLACRTAAPRVATSTPPAEERSVFTDSLLHVERCMPLALGTDWRKVCTPKNQAVKIR